MRGYFGQALSLMSGHSNAAIDLTLDNLLCFKKVYGPFSGIQGRVATKPLVQDRQQQQKLNYSVTVANINHEISTIQKHKNKTAS